MQQNNLIPIVRREGVTIYGQVINSKNQLGQFQVHSDHSGWDGRTYSLLVDAEVRMKAVIGYANQK